MTVAASNPNPDCQFWYGVDVWGIFVLREMLGEDCTGTNVMT